MPLPAGVHIVRPMRPDFSEKMLVAFEKRTGKCRGVWRAKFVRDQNLEVLVTVQRQLSWQCCQSDKQKFEQKNFSILLMQDRRTPAETFC